MPKFHIETLDVNFEYQEKLLKSVEQGIKETKKKLNDTEIMITLEPNKTEMQEWLRWEKAMDNILHRPTNLNFPNLNRMRKDHEMKKLSQIEASRRSKMASRDAAAVQAQRIMSKQAQNMQKKILEGKCKFGSSIEGEQIGVVEHYKGLNTYDVSGKRVLRRKDGRSHMVDPENPDIPPWMGPMYYFDNEQSHNRSQKSDRYYKLPFEASREDERSGAIIDRENLTRRRKELRTAALNHRADGSDDVDPFVIQDSPTRRSSVTFQRTFADVKASIDRDDKGEPDVDWDELYSVSDNHSQHRDNSSVGSASHYSMSVASGVPLPVADVLNASTSPSLLETPYDSLQGSAVSTARNPLPISDNVLVDASSSNFLLQSSSQRHLAPVQSNNDALLSATRATGQHLIQQPPPLLSSSASLASMTSAGSSAMGTMTSSKQLRHKHHEDINPKFKQNRHRVPLDPLFTHHAYALKILQTDPSVQQAASYGQEASLNPHLQMYQQKKSIPNRTKDYTFHALANQTPLVLDNFNIENSVASVAQQMQQQQQQAPQQPQPGQSSSTFDSNANTATTSRVGTTSSTNSTGASLLKFSSDIFKKPTVDYRTSDELLKEAKVKFNASHLVPDPFSSAPGGGNSNRVGSTVGITTISPGANAAAGKISRSNNRNAMLIASAERRRREQEYMTKGTSEAAASMEVTRQLLIHSRAESSNRSRRPYGLLASLDLYSASTPVGSSSSMKHIETATNNVASSSSKPSSPSLLQSTVVSPIPRHMSPPRSSPLRGPNISSQDIQDSLPTMDDFALSKQELFNAQEPVGQMIDEWMTTREIQRSHDFNAYSPKRRERKPLDTNRTGKMKSRYRSKVRGSSPSKNTGANSTDEVWDAASVLQELATMKGLLLDVDPAEVYPALIEANKDRDIDNIILR